MRVIGYVRVSTNEQEISLDSQKSKIKSYCDLFDLELVEIYSDFGKSAKDLNRPAIKEALEVLATDSIEGIIVTNVDRLTRNVRDLGNLVETTFHKKTLISIAQKIDTSSATGRLMLGLLGLVSQWEREVIGERTSNALQHLIEQGVTLGRLPYGSERGNIGPSGRLQIETNKQEIEVISTIVDMRSSDYTYREIADELNHRKIPTKRGGKWHASTVSNIDKRRTILI